MIKKFFIIFSLILSTFFSYSSDLTDDGNTPKEYTINYNSSGFIEFLRTNIGKTISIYIKNADITLRGILIDLYTDSLTILTFFKQKIYIPKESVGYIEIKEEKKDNK